MSESNQRVTNAVLQKDLEHLASRVLEWRNEAREAHTETERRITMLETWHATSSERWRSHEKTHDALNSKSRTGDIVTGIYASIVGALAFFLER